MDEITSADVDQPTIERCRDLLGDDGIDLTDEEVDRVREHADVVARVVIELSVKNPQDALDDEQPDHLAVGSQRV